MAVVVRLVRACGSKQPGRSAPTVPLPVRLVRACGSKHVRFYSASPLKRSGS